MNIRDIGAAEGTPSVLEIPRLVCQLARLGVRLETLEALMREIAVEWIVDPSWRLSYAHRKNLQFMVETDIALATARKHNVDAMFIRLKSLEPVFLAYKRYARPNEFGPPPSDIDSATIAGLARVLHDSCSLIDDLIGRLAPFRDDGTLLVVASNHGVRSTGRGYLQEMAIDPDRLLRVLGWSGSAVHDISGNGAFIRIPGDNENREQTTQLQSLLTQAQWEPEYRSDIRRSPTRRIFSVNANRDGMEISLLTPSDLSGNADVTIGEWSGKLSDILSIDPPGGAVASDGLLMLAGPHFRPGSRATASFVYDIVPTILYSLKMDLATYFQGRPLQEIFDETWYNDNPPRIVESYIALPEGPEGAGSAASTAQPESTVSPETAGPQPQGEYSELPPEVIEENR
jgi:hypothetical protein